MQPIVRFLADLVRLAPGLVVAITVLLTIGLGTVSPNAVLAEGNESFSPNNAELKALERAGDLFGGEDTVSETVTQTIVKGDDVLTADALAVVLTLEAELRGSSVGDLLSDRLDEAEPRPAVLSWLGGVLQAAAMEGIDPLTLTDQQVKDFYAASVDSPQGAFLEALFTEPTGDAPDGSAAPAQVGMVLTFWDIDAVGDAVVDGRFEGVDPEEGEFQFAGLAAAHEIAQDVTEQVGTDASGLDLGFLSLELIFADESFLDEIGKLFGMAFGIILIILGYVYFLRPSGAYKTVPALRRTVADVLLTLFAITASITWMSGLAVLLGPGYLDVILGQNPVTQIIPILLIGLGVDYAIHLTSRYREAISSGADVVEAASEATRTVGVALALATVTTVLGFLTNLLNPVPALRDFGVLSAVGILVAFLMTLTFVPAVRVLLDRRAEAKGVLPRTAMGSTSERLLPNLIARTSVLAVRHNVKVLATSVVLGLFGMLGLANLSTDFSFVDFVPDDQPIVQTFNEVDEYFGGGFGETSTVLIEGEVATPAVHNTTVEAVTRTLVDVPNVVTFGGQVANESVVSHLIALTTPGPAQDPAFTAAAADLGLDVADLTVAADADVAGIYRAALAADPSLVNVLARDGDDFVAARAEVNTQAGMLGAFPLAEALTDAFAGAAEADATVIATSQDIVSETIRTELNSSQISSLLLTLGVATALLGFVMWRRHRKALFGVVTVAPVGLVLLLTFGMMTLTGISFNPMTSMISALAIGIGVPFTIHVAHRFEEDLHAQPSAEEAMQSTLRHTGGALAGSAFTTMAGFAILVTASILPFRQLGLVVTYAIGFALVASVLVLPSCLYLWYQWDAKRGTPLGGVKTTADEVVDLTEADAPADESERELVNA